MSVVSNGLRRLAFASAMLMIPVLSWAELPGKHPYYLHAITDLRGARYQLEHRPGDAAVSGREDVAIQEIDAAIGEIRKVASEDKEDIHEHPSRDVKTDEAHEGRLTRARQLLDKALADVQQEEDDPTARGLRERVIHHVELAIKETEGAIQDVLKQDTVKQSTAKHP